MSQLSITALEHVDDGVVDDINRLVSQLGKDAAPRSAAYLERLIGSDSNTVFAARLDGRPVVGMLTLVVTVLPTGIVARLEDVVVDDAFRGRGIAPALVREALDEAARRGAHQVDLTSRPSRVSAHRLYEKVGFARRETQVFRYSIDPHEPHPNDPHEPHPNEARS
ncbi:GNAT family N-acetyltransferase [Streptomyces sp. NBC_01508]|uniref:GNAT family N-acetyltransferase n=1 Tax=Streptomyces sp. NBC_01508 TaxID=2903888 RepID=UPI003869B8F4